MAKNARLKRRPNEVLEREVWRLLYERGYDITTEPAIVHGLRADLVASHREGGRLRSIAIDIEVQLNFANIRRVVARIKRIMATTKVTIDEYWIVVSGQFSNIVAARDLDQRIKIFEIEELRTHLGRLPKRPSKRSSRALTKVGLAVEVSKKEIMLAISGLILQIDDKLEKLGGERPNSDDAKAELGGEISDLERMKAELERIRELVAAFTKGNAPEKEVVKSVKTFRDGIQAWWDKGHDSLLTTAAKSALFVSSVGVLALMKADSAAAVTVAGALIGGKAIKTIKKLRKKMLG